ncbi:hypothetical protein V8E53_003324 [Lactarius tabidus]
MSRIKLADITALTLYKGEVTSSRRGQPIPQLVCKGKPCKLFTPDVVRCTHFSLYVTPSHLHDAAKCEADLPESLRLGRWTGPGDSYVLKGARTQCVSWPSRPHSDYPVFRILLSGVPPPGMEALTNYIFSALLIGVLGLILYKFLRPCFEGRNRVWPPRPPRPGPSSNSGWFPRGYDDRRRPPPPPYSKYPTSTDSSTGSVQGDQDRFGFWSGAALGGLGTYLLTRQRAPEPQPRRYDWEEERYFSRPDSGPVPRTSGSSPRQQPMGRSWESREGPSNLGSTRRSTGYGGSTVR